MKRVKNNSSLLVMTNLGQFNTPTISLSLHLRKLAAAAAMRFNKRRISPAGLKNPGIFVENVGCFFRMEFNLTCYIIGLCLLSHPMYGSEKSALDDQITQEAESSVSLIKKYDQDFDIKLSKSSGKEALIIANLDKLGIKLDDIDEYFYDNLRTDIADLNATLKSVRSRSRKDKNVAQMVDSLKVSCRNASNLYSLMRKHYDFVKGYQIINFYRSLPVDQDKLVAWVIIRQDGIYPLLDYVDIVDSQTHWIYWLRHAHYPNMVKKIQATKKAMMKSASMLRKTRAFKDEFHVKQEVDMKAAMLSAQQEIARAQTQATLIR